jgi:hypothetical protein
MEKNGELFPPVFINFYTIVFWIMRMKSMFTQNTTSNARLVPSVKLFIRCITAHCAHRMHYSQTNESNITLLIHLIILTDNTISISVFIDALPCDRQNWNTLINQ